MLLCAYGLRDALAHGWGVCIPAALTGIIRHGDSEISQVPGRPSSAFAILSDPGRTSAPGLYCASVLSLLCYT